MSYLLLYISIIYANPVITANHNPIMLHSKFERVLRSKVQEYDFKKRRDKRMRERPKKDVNKKDVSKK